jgi:hypothetical protein
LTEARVEDEIPESVSPVNQAGIERLRPCVVCGNRETTRAIRMTVVESDVRQGPSSAVSGIRHFATRRTWKGAVPLCRRHRRTRNAIRWGCPLTALAGIGVAVYANVAYPHPPEYLVWITVVLVVLPLLVFGIHQQWMMRIAERV